MSLALVTARSVRCCPRSQNLPVYDFLTSSLVSWRRNVGKAPIATAAVSIEAESESKNMETNKPLPQKRPLSQAQRHFLDSALRVNQAGELAAVLIYTAQTPPLIRSHPQLRPLMKHMYDQEEGHFKTFNHLIAKHRIRPTLMYPIWKAAATALGWSTAVMGREAAMACTEAVETEIGGHYNEQIRVLLDWAEKLEARGEEVGEEMKDLLQKLRQIRDEELEHLDHAVDNDAKSAEPYELLTNVIRSGCRTAIWISERI